MNTNEITLTESQLLRQAIAEENDTKFSTEDLALIVETEQYGVWSKPLTAQELISELNSWTK